MPESKQGHCVLCNIMAQYECHPNQRRYYECPECCQYAITERAVRRLKKHPESKTALAKIAAEMPHDVNIIEIFVNNINTIDWVPVPRTKYSR